MRFQCRIYFEKGTVLPFNYRQYFLSLIKEAIMSSEDGQFFYDRYYTKNKEKPFTFSVYLASEKVEDGLKLKYDNVNFYFSTQSFEFIFRVYNGLNNISKKIKDSEKKEKDYKFSFGEYKVISIRDFYYHEDKDFSKDVLSFKTLSPFLVRDLSDGDYYIYPENVNFNQQLKYAKKVNIEEFVRVLKISLTSLIKNFDSNFDENNIKTQDIIDIKLKDLKPSPIIHGSNNENKKVFKMTFPALKGLLNITSKPEYLKLIYDLGIGARRSEGFGMLEVVDEV